MPNIKAENVFGESYGKTTGASVSGAIKKGHDFTPEEKFVSMNQKKFTNQSDLLRQMKPAEIFEPGYDSIYYQNASAGVSYFFY